MFMLSPLGSRCSLGVRGAACGSEDGAAGEDAMATSLPLAAADFRKRLRTRWSVGCRVGVEGVEGVDICFLMKSVRMAEPSW